jgi:hypothetical protein
MKECIAPSTALTRLDEQNPFVSRTVAGAINFAAVRFITHGEANDRMTPGRNKL